MRTDEMKSSASKIVLDSYESLFGTDTSTDDPDKVRMIPLDELYTFKGHPFRVLDDERMYETTESVRKYGVLVPGIARIRPEGGYEIISGHRRKRACELAGINEMPMFIRDYSDDEATVVMVDANIQRDDILPSEKAKAYRMKFDALKHRGSRGKHTADEVGEAAGDSATTVKRYIRLSFLNDYLLDLVDEGKITVISGEQYIKCSVQKAVNLIHELETGTGIGLIEKTRPGMGKANVFYIKNFMAIIEEISDSEDEEPSCESDKDEQKKLKKAKTSKNQKSGLPETRNQDFQKLEVKTSKNQKSRLLKTRSQDWGILIAHYTRYRGRADREPKGKLDRSG